MSYSIDLGFLGEFLKFIKFYVLLILFFSLIGLYGRGSYEGFLSNFFFSLTPLSIIYSINPISRLYLKYPLLSISSILIFSRLIFALGSLI